MSRTPSAPHREMGPSWNKPSNIRDGASGNMGHEEMGPEWAKGKAKSGALERMVIRPAENGGHTVEHQYKATRSSKSGATMSYPEPESHVFGPSEHGKMMDHIANHLGLREIEHEDEP